MKKPVSYSYILKSSYILRCVNTGLLQKKKWIPMCFWLKEPRGADFFEKQKAMPLSKRKRLWIALGFVGRGSGLSKNVAE